MVVLVLVVGDQTGGQREGKKKKKEKEKEAGGGGALHNSWVMWRWSSARYWIHRRGSCGTICSCSALGSRAVARKSEEPEPTQSSPPPSSLGNRYNRNYRVLFFFSCFPKGRLPLGAGRFHVWRRDLTDQATRARFGRALKVDMRAHTETPTPQTIIALR